MYQWEVGKKIGKSTQGGPRKVEEVKERKKLSQGREKVKRKRE